MNVYSIDVYTTYTTYTYTLLCDKISKSISFPYNLLLNKINETFSQYNTSIFYIFNHYFSAIMDYYTL